MIQIPNYDFEEFSKYSLQEISKEIEKLQNKISNLDKNSLRSYIRKYKNFDSVSYLNDKHIIDHFCFENSNSPHYIYSKNRYYNLHNSNFQVAFFYGGSKNATIFEKNHILSYFLKESIRFCSSNLWFYYFLNGNLKKRSFKYVDDLKFVLEKYEIGNHITLDSSLDLELQPRFIFLIAIHQSIDVEGGNLIINNDVYEIESGSTFIYPFNELYNSGITKVTKGYKYFLRVFIY